MNASPNLRSPSDPFTDAARASLYDQIGRSIGADKTHKLIADFGGRRLYIPVAPAPGDRVTSSIGLVAALAMARVFGGDRLVIPVTIDHARRRKRIFALRANHLSVARIARQLRCSERHVYKVLAEGRDGRLDSTTPAPSAEHFKRGSITRRS